MQIPIQNIYYLLCYAWNKLEEKDRVNVSAEECSELVDLFAKVLVNGTRILLKRGIDRSYVEITDEIAGVKGKLAFSETVKRNLLARQRTICSFDEFSPNILLNQILVTTMHRLLKVKELDKTLKDDVRSLIGMFPQIDRIELSYAVFNQISLNRNSRFYGFIINVCEMIYANSLPSEEPGELSFMDFTRDENKMNQLYEAFLRNFYKLEQARYDSVKGEVIKWKFEGAASSMQHLPEMQTDITLENEKEKIIIDAKYYRQTMSNYYEKDRVHSTNLYQLFSYLLNQKDGSEKPIKANEIFLYPTGGQKFFASEAFSPGWPVFTRPLKMPLPWAVSMTSNVRRGARSA